MSNTNQLDDLLTGISQTVSDTRAYQTRNVHTVYTFPGYTKAEWDVESGGTSGTYTGQQRVDPNARKNTAQRSCLRAG